MPDGYKFYLFRRILRVHYWAWSPTQDPPELVHHTLGEYLDKGSRLVVAVGPPLQILQKNVVVTISNW